MTAQSTLLMVVFRVASSSRLQTCQILKIEYLDTRSTVGASPRTVLQGQIYRQNHPCLVFLDDQDGELKGEKNKIIICNPPALLTLFFP